MYTTIYYTENPIQPDIWDEMMALSSSLLCFWGGLQKLSGLLMDQGPSKRYGCLVGAGRVGNLGRFGQPLWKVKVLKIKT